MSAPNNYDRLVSAIQALAEDDSTEFLAYIPTAIFLAEERLIKELDTQGVKAVTTVTATSGNPLLAKPSGYRFTHDLYFVATSGSAVEPSFATKGFIKDYWPMVASTDEPKYIADYDNNSWVLAPTPDGNYQFTVTYVKQLQHLSSTVSTNYFTDFCADVLFYATMSHMAEFMKDYSTIEVWETKYQNAIKTLNNEGRRSRRTDSSNPMNPEGGINTLTGGV